MGKMIKGQPQMLNNRAVAGKVRKDFFLSDFITADKTLINKQWNPVGYYSVLADEARMIGFGYGQMDSADARMYGLLKVKTTGAEIKGEIKFVYTDSMDTHKGETSVYGTHLLNTSATDVTKQIPLNETGLIAEENRRIWLWIYPAGAADVVFEPAASTLNIPGTRFNLE